MKDDVSKTAPALIHSMKLQGLGVSWLVMIREG